MCKDKEEEEEDDNGSYKISHYRADSATSSSLKVRVSQIGGVINFSKNLGLQKYGDTI